MDIVPSDRTRPARPNIVARLLLFLTGIDGDTLAECPPADHWNVLAIALLMLLVWGYQASVLALVGHRLVEPDGGFNVGIAAGAGLIAFLIVEIDAHAFVRAGYVADGYRLLKQAGLDLTQGRTGQNRRLCLSRSAYSPCLYASLCSRGSLLA